MKTEYKKKIKELMKKIENQNSKNKELERKMIEDLAKDCAEYISSIIKMENTISLVKTGLEANEYQETITNLDNRRADTHNLVLSK
ncbi:DUF3232 domain-containing protein [Clostridium estertheticum]|uniref:DUF3232 domain-containing protein n=1 Tax=Clostridium estertheticum TaxID=238834 RepID=UPI001C0CBB68|nr:DUF3232 domain-containing protein [Clostridium estertheticum]MBU3200314.1 DUF3232 domain-containing protein [Clostridium estertheticum]WAG64483.1 DUF3232 domain-containing protein [Clostridium estertheticum]